MNRRYTIVKNNNRRDLIVRGSRGLTGASGSGAGGGIDLTAFQNDDYIQVSVDANGIKTLVRATGPAPGSTIPDGTANGQGLIWNSNTSAWVAMALPTELPRQRHC